MQCFRRSFSSVPLPGPPSLPPEGGRFWGIWEVLLIREYREREMGQLTKLRSHESWFIFRSLANAREGLVDADKFVIVDRMSLQSPALLLDFMRMYFFHNFRKYYLRVSEQGNHRSFENRHGRPLVRKSARESCELNTPHYFLPHSNSLSSSSYSAFAN